VDSQRDIHDLDAATRCRTVVRLGYDEFGEVNATNQVLSGVPEKNRGLHPRRTGVRRGHLL
jgi:hypothetical protein